MCKTMYHHFPKQNYSVSQYYLTKMLSLISFSRTLARLLSLRKQIICVITKILCVGSIPFISIVVELLLLHAEQYYPLGSKPTNPNTEGLRAWVNLIPFGQVLS